MKTEFLTNLVLPMLGNTTWKDILDKTVIHTLAPLWVWDDLYVNCYIINTYFDTKGKLIKLLSHFVARKHNNPAIPF